MTEPGRLPADAVVLGLDLGGTQIRAAATLPTGERLGQCSVATPLADGEEAIFAACAGVLRGTERPPGASCAPGPDGLAPAGAASG